jgi:hypothetical protein
MVLGRLSPPEQKDTPFSFSQFPRSIEQNSRSPKTMTLYFENNGKTGCRLVGEFLEVAAAQFWQQ